MCAVISDVQTTKDAHTEDDNNPHGRVASLSS